jgi:hypothetical protein
MKTTNHVGQRFGRLLVTEQHSAAPTASGQRHTVCTCQCDCGAVVAIFATNLRRGFSTSCGCYSRELHTRHGCHSEVWYPIWAGMISRCYNPHDLGFSRYGGRGITVCDEWRGSPALFMSDMGPRPSKTHTVDRIDNDGPYSPENCRWATLVEQNNNKRSNVAVTIGGETHNLCQWYAILGISKAVYYHRRRHGFTPEQALTLPKQTGHPFVSNQATTNSDSRVMPTSSAE